MEQEPEPDGKINKRQRQNQKKQNQYQKKQNRIADDTSRIPPPETYTIPLIPLNYAAPQLGDPDYELLAELGMADFAVKVVESKIREFYAEACEATLLFNRKISKGPALQNASVRGDFDNWMKGLAMQKRKEWKELIDAELMRKITKQRPEQIDKVRSELLRRGAIKQGGVIPKQEAEPQRVKHFIEKVVKQVKFSSVDNDEELGDMPPLVYAKWFSSV